MKTHDKLFMVSAQKWSQCELVSRGYLHPVDFRKTENGFQTFFFVLRKSQFFCVDHQMWAATDQQVTKNTWQSVLKKVTLNLSSHLLLIFHPSSLSRTFPNARLHDKTAIFWLFPSPAPSGYQLCESSDKGKWLRTVWVLGGLWVWDDIETVHSVLLASL